MDLLLVLGSLLLLLMLLHQLSSREQLFTVSNKYKIKPDILHREMEQDVLINTDG
jgi:hypothetical protein